jgi:hypothetical protein
MALSIIIFLSYMSWGPFLQRILLDCRNCRYSLCIHYCAILIQISCVEFHPSQKAKVVVPMDRFELCEVDCTGTFANIKYAC